jgi:hypothetical protein
MITKPLTTFKLNPRRKFVAELTQAYWFHKIRDACKIWRTVHREKYSPLPSEKA